MRVTERGFACVALHNPKSGENVGGVMRACGVFGASLVVVAGPRFNRFHRHPTDTMKAWRHIPVLEVEEIVEAQIYKCPMIGVEIVPGARSLPGYVHPPRAMYVFGPEDGSLPERVLARCRDVVVIPVQFCLNLAAIVNVVLYDRLAKQERS